ncbi:plasmid mobilization protein [Rhodobacter sp. TJ_12]|uniref:plasmid mobilization protein n=1 Tax=Rhodobacter sp. TJ_12 TaxID=2029399 RepID=UPI001CC1B964|nr:plasmid mobilization relaxosome protein MobC [Rhodobacter sp. TJ_12]
MAKVGDGKVRSEKRRATCRLSKRVTASELKAFADRAKEAGFENPQEFLSALVLGNTAQTNFNKRDMTLILGHLGKIGSNINQIAKHFNSGKIKNADDADLAPMSAAIIETAAAIREKLK